MKGPALTIQYQEIAPAQLEVIRPLWEKLKAHHLPLSAPLVPRRAARTFEARKQELLAKSASGHLRIELAYVGDLGSPIAYCISTLTPNGTGEIDSIYVEQGYRGQGVGAVLTQRALVWLDEHDAKAMVVVVAFGNDAALEFYTRLGFVADTISLRQVSEVDPQSRQKQSRAPGKRD